MKVKKPERYTPDGVLHRLKSIEQFEDGKNFIFVHTRSQCFDINEVLFVSCVCVASFARLNEKRCWASIRIAEQGEKWAEKWLVTYVLFCVNYYDLIEVLLTLVRLRYVFVHWTRFHSMYKIQFSDAHIFLLQSCIIYCPRVSAACFALSPPVAQQKWFTDVKIFIRHRCGFTCLSKAKQKKI